MQWRTRYRRGCFPKTPYAGTGWWHRRRRDGRGATLESLAVGVPLQIGDAIKRMLHGCESQTTPRISIWKSLRPSLRASFRHCFGASPRLSPLVAAVRSDRPASASGYVRGQHVFVKPPGASCTTVWPEGVVTDKGDGVGVEVDGVRRHTADIRPVPETDVTPWQAE